jgi:hypothetical protein
VRQRSPADCAAHCERCAARFFTRSECRQDVNRSIRDCQSTTACSENLLRRSLGVQRATAVAVAGGLRPSAAVRWLWERCRARRGWVNSPVWLDRVVGNNGFLAALCLEILGKLPSRVTQEAMWQGMFVRSIDVVWLVPLKRALLIRQDRLIRLYWLVNAP